MSGYTHRELQGIQQARLQRGMGRSCLPQPLYFLQQQERNWRNSPKGSTQALLLMRTDESLMAVRPLLNL